VTGLCGTPGQKQRFEQEIDPTKVPPEAVAFDQISLMSA